MIGFIVGKRERATGDVVDYDCPAALIFSRIAGNFGARRHAKNPAKRKAC
jgi:hypothetical protein